MKLRTALKTITATKILISSTSKRADDIYLIIDYLGDKEAFSRALKERQKLEKENPDVARISYNKACGCIELDID